MRVLVFPRDLELGGSSINAVDLAVALRARGHETAVTAAPGPLLSRVREQGLPFFPLTVPPRHRPAPRVVRGVRSAAREFGADLVHAYEYWPTVEAFYAVSLLGCLPVVSTVMSMDLPGFLPATVPLTVGFEDLLRQARAQHPSRSYLLEPPVDTATDHPGLAVDEFRRRHGLTRGHLDVVIVSRVAVHMKLEGLERVLDAVARLACDAPVRLVVVGGGSALPALRERAGQHERRLGRPVAVFTGPLADPRPAYAMADVVVGMGSSALRGMAFARPVVVVGEEGFSLPVAPETFAGFGRTGFYGVGAGRTDPDPLVGQLGRLLDDAAERRRLGAFGLRTVRERYSLAAAAATLERVYTEAADRRRSPLRGIGDAAGTATRVARHKISDRARARRQVATT